MKLRTLLFFLIITTVVISNGQHRRFNPEVFYLDNGLTVFLNPDPHASTVYGLVVVKAGSKNDPADATGLAHYQEHMLFKGTQELGTINWEQEKIHIENIFNLYDQLAATEDESERKKIQQQINAESIEANKYAVSNELDKLLKSIGSTAINAFTSADMTAYFNEFPPSQIEKWLDIYSHRFINPVFRGFQAELEVVYEEYNMYNDMFFMPLFEKFGKSFFKNHPYGQQTTIGTLEHLKNPSLTKMYEFFQTWYVPNNMALIISGNFNAQEIKPLIESYFSTWKRKPVPEFTVNQEDPFQGREVVNVKMSPVKIGILGYRTAPANHNDRYALSVMYRLLSNTNQTGLLDQLMLDNKLIAAQALQLPYKDHGAMLILVIPKIIGQSLEDAEKLILTEVQKLKEGNFDETLIEAIKKELYIEYVTSLESHSNACVLLAQAFVNETPVDELTVYPDAIMRVTLEDVVNVANKYIGQDYLAFFSTMGFPKKEKIEKPGYEPIVNKTQSQSEYYNRISQWQPDTKSPALSGYYESVQKIQLLNGQTLYYTENPYNNVFTYTIRFFLNKVPDPYTEIAVRAMDLAGTSKKPLKELKSFFASIGVSYSFSYSGDIAEVRLKGLESGLNQALQTISELIQSPVLDEEKLKIIYDEGNSMRKLETAEAESISEMLYQYVVYGDLSTYINRPSLKEIKRISPEKINFVIRDIFSQYHEFHYSGSQESLEEIIDFTGSNFTETKSTIPEKRFELPRIKSEQNRVVFVHKKNTIQSKIFFHISGNTHLTDEEAYAEMFNAYFGGGFSGLVLREIREFRSMAYSAGAKISRPLNAHSDYNFTGYIGTQADKTLEAIEIFMELLRNMPENPEDAESIATYLQLSLFSQIPDFRSASSQYSSEHFLGWNEDPVITKNRLYQTLSFSELLLFYNTHLKSKPITIMVVADKKRLNHKDLSKFGRVEILKIKELYTK